MKFHLAAKCCVCQFESGMKSLFQQSKGARRIKFLFRIKVMVFFCGVQILLDVFIDVILLLIVLCYARTEKMQSIWCHLFKEFNLSV